MKNRILEAIIICIGIIFLGISLYSGINRFAQRDRFVSVKGLAEKEVMADKVIWPLLYKDVSSDLQQLHDSFNKKNVTIINFLKSNGITDDEISVSAPNVVDLQAYEYSNNQNKYRYNITSVITVSSTNVDLVRKVMSKQAELFSEGIAVSTDNYQAQTLFLFTKLNDIKPQMIEAATKNARDAAEKFANDSGSKLGKIKNANQGQFSITDRDGNTPYIKNVRVVSTVDYYLND